MASAVNILLRTATLALRTLCTFVATHQKYARCNAVTIHVLDYFEYFKSIAFGALYSHCDLWTDYLGSNVEWSSLFEH